MRDNRKGKISAMGADARAESLPRSDNRFQAGGDNPICDCVDWGSASGSL